MLHKITSNPNYKENKATTHKTMPTMKVNKYIQFSLIGLVIKFLSNSNVYIKAGVKISIVIQCFRMDQLKSIIPGKKNNKPNKMPNA